ncbi:MAG: CubicO group peptidase (beta-lactamase class C family) [Arenicella sp.]|jgi:serine beta-lactamase-like protein LACTB
MSGPTKELTVKHRRLLGLAGFVIVVVCVYGCFSPVLVWSYGWSSLPSNQRPVVSEVLAPDHQAAIAEARGILAEIYSDLNSPAVSVAVAKDGDLLWREAIGFADLDEMIPVSLESQFRIGSTSKAVTSVAMGRLIDANKIDIDLTVDHYIDSVEYGDKITTRQLLTHTAGIRDYGLCLCFPIWEYYNTKHFDSVADAVDVFAGSPLLFEPGTEYRYTSYGYTMVSFVMEAAANKDFLSLMKDELFVPLKMSSTVADQVHQSVQNRVKFYDVKRGRYKEVYQVDNSIKWAGGGFLSTPTDLVRMGNALFTRNYLKQVTLDNMFSPQILSNGEVSPERYALGWRLDTLGKLIVDIDEAKKDLTVAHHGGVALGGLSFLMLIPEENLVISIVANRNLDGDFPLGDYAMRIIKPFI